MATNFFEQQDKARKRTGLLVACFVMGMVLMTIVLYLVAMVVMNIVGSDQEHGIVELEYWNGGVLAAVAGLVFLVVGGASLSKIIALRSGGRVVAEMVGAKPLDPDSRTHRERVALNVVEEMAIASGTPVPPLYVVEDNSINAFAAGWSPNDAIVSLNRGTIERLDRDELQGVVAHEFSHIFNGDMRINIRLIGVIHGLLVLGFTGWVMMRFIGPAMLGSGRRSSSKDGGGGAIGVGIMLFGLALMICGFIGTFFGRLVQAAVSRQREFLADASAVQYTRNPDGIGGALEKIMLVGRTPSEDLPEKASDISHMFFTKAMDSIFATHPPLPDRIARVKGIPVDQVMRDLKDMRIEDVTPSTPPDAVSAVDSSEAHGRRAGGDILGAVILGSVLEDSMGRIGTVDQASLDQSRQILDSIPSPLRQATRSMATARMVVFCLLLDEDEADQAMQWTHLEKTLKPDEYSLTQALSSHMASLDPWARLPLLDLCIPAMSHMSPQQYQAFRKTLDTLVNIDGRIDRWEWVVDTVLDRHLEERFHKPGSERRAKARLAACQEAINTVLATLACTGAEDPAEARSAFAAAVEHLGWQAELPDPKALNLGVLRQALRSIRRVRFADRRSFLEACEICILHDGRTTIEEAETLRAVAESIDCPMPPLRSGSA